MNLETWRAIAHTTMYMWQLMTTSQCSIFFPHDRTELSADKSVWQILCLAVMVLLDSQIQGAVKKGRGVEGGDRPHLAGKVPCTIYIYSGHSKIRTKNKPSRMHQCIVGEVWCEFSLSITPIVTTTEFCSSRHCGYKTLLYIIMTILT
jgi:hypothetical protein